MDLGATEGSEQRRTLRHKCSRAPSGVRGGNSGGHGSRGTVLGRMGMVEARPGGVEGGGRKGRLGIDSEDRATGTC